MDLKWCHFKSRFLSSFRITFLTPVAPKRAPKGSQKDAFSVMLEMAKLSYCRSKSHFFSSECETDSWTLFETSFWTLPTTF